MRRSAIAFVIAPLAMALAGCASTSAAGDTPTPVPSGAPAAAAQPGAGSIDLAAMARQRPAGSTLVVVVRHAEKGATPADDPPLSAEGTVRAQALATLFRDVPATAVVVTPRRRTAETAAFVAQARGLTPEPIGFGASMNDHVNGVASAVRRNAGGVVLVVGHSNTVPMIVHALGGPHMADLCDAQYSQLFVLQLPAEGGTPRVERATYGAADPANAGSCAGMKP